MKIHYQAGEYELVRWFADDKGRKATTVTLTKSQAKALFELMRDNRMNIQSLEIVK